MERSALETFSSENLAVLGLATGFILLLWVLVGRQIRIWVFDLPAIESRVVRYIVGGIASCVILVSSFVLLGAPRVLPPGKLPSGPTLRVLTDLAQEELRVFRELVAKFGRNHRLTVEVMNVGPKEAVDKLKEERIDLLTFDINARHELIRNDLIEELPADKYKGLVPSAIHPILMEYTEVDNKRYFIPFRPNVRLVFLNKRKFEELDDIYQNLDRNHPNLPKTWPDVMELAKRFHVRDGEARVVIEATDTDAPLFLLELIRSAGGDPRNLFDQESKRALEFLRKLWPYVSHKSSQVDWQTASGFLLSDSVYLARNWTWALTIIHNSGRDEDFVVYAGWSWEKESSISGLLGGEFIALPKNAPHKELAIELMSFLTSKEAQTKIVEQLSWPAMRLDAVVGLKEWQQHYQRAINHALLHAEPVPDYWSPEVVDIYRRMFEAVTSSDARIENILETFQAEIDRLGISER